MNIRPQTLRTRFRSTRPVALSLLALFGVTTAPAFARDWDDRDGRWSRGVDYAQVVDVEPMVERVRYREPVEQCWDVAYPERGIDRTRSTLLGGVLGAVVGNQLGSGDGRRVATVAGAVLGSALGNGAANREQARRDRDDPYGERVRYEERCAVRDETRFEERVRAYRVTYRYLGRQYVTEMPYDPGRRLRVAVDARPL